MSDATLIIELQVGGQTLRLSPVEAMELWAELGTIFDRVFPVGEENLKVGPGSLIDPTPAPQVVPVYVPWYPAQPTLTPPFSPWGKEWCSGTGGWKMTTNGGSTAVWAKLPDGDA